MLGLSLGLSLGAQRAGGGASALAIVQAAGGAYFTLDAGQVFQDRSVTPSVPAGVGDPAGTIVGMDGSWFAIAPADGDRATLALDPAGNRYLATSAGAQRWVVQNAGGGHLVLLPGQHTTIVGVTTASSTAYAVSDIGGRGQWTMAAASGTPNNLRTRDAGDAASVLETYTVSDTPLIVTFFSAPPASTRIDGLATINGTTVASLRDYSSAGIVRLEIGTARSGFSSNGPSRRFYGGAFVPSVLSDAAAKTIADDLSPRVHPPLEPVSADPVMLDFVGDVFEWGGGARALSDLTDNSDGSYTLNYMDWVGGAYVYSVDIRTPEAANSEQPFFTLENDLHVERVRRGTGAVASPTYDRPGQPQLFTAIPSSSGAGADVTRLTFAIRPGQNVRVRRDGAPLGDVGSPRLRQHFDRWTSARVWRTFTGGEVLAVRMQGGVMTDAEINTMHETGSGLPVHVLGDSFVVFTTPGLPGALMNAAAENLGYLYTSADGVGGTTLTQQLARYTASGPYRSTLIVADGALETSQTQQQVLNALDGMVALLDGHSRWIFLQPNPIHPIGDSRRTTHDEYIAAIRPHIGAAFEDTLDAMQCAHDDTTESLDRVALGQYPANMTSDNIHLNAASVAIWGRIMFSALLRRGYLTGLTVTVPDAPEDFAEDALTLSWSLPADDGLDPVREFRVSVEDAPGSGVFDLVYTGRLRRHTLTGLTAGTWAVRVEARNAVGWGPPAEIAVTV